MTLTLSNQVDTWPRARDRHNWLGNARRQLKTRAFVFARSLGDAAGKRFHKLTATSRLR